MMTHAIATVAALAGIVLTAGSNPWLALGLGLLVFSAVLVLNDLTDRLQRIEQAVVEVRDHVEAAALAEGLTRGGAADTPGSPQASSTP
jgi:hypothetical protein